MMRHLCVCGLGSGHIFHMPCLFMWLGTAASKQQWPMDRRPWGTYVCPLLFMGLGMHETDILASTVTAERKANSGYIDAHPIALRLSEGLFTTL